MQDRKQENKARVDKNKWIRCVGCGHKLGKVIEHEGKEICLVEIKCHSCKTVNLCAISNIDIQEV